MKSQEVVASVYKYEDKILCVLIDKPYLNIHHIAWLTYGEPDTAMQYKTEFKFFINQ